MHRSLLESITRRYFLDSCFTRLGATSLALMLQRSVTAGRGAAGLSSLPHIAPRAKRVIFLTMAGAPSQLDLFEFKPELSKRNGQLCPEEFLKNQNFAFIVGRPKLLGSPFKFSRHGETGSHFSELLPHLASVADDLCIIRSMHTDQFNHSPAQLLLQTGSPLVGRPSMGAWFSYGLGSETDNLPTFVVLISGELGAGRNKALWGSGFVPTVHQGVELRSQGDPVLYLSNPAGMTREQRRDSIDTLNRLNQLRHQETANPEIVTRIEQYEMAFRMQSSVPELVDLTSEPKHIGELYGVTPGQPSFASNCLLARRLAERGVRFIQVYHGNWDHHGADEREDLEHALVARCKEIDQAAAGLVRDLKQRGMLDETLVVWGGEFGRTPMSENRMDVTRTDVIGRDHHPRGFTMWMAGGGVKPGLYGSTDELGYNVAENPVHIHDLQATILHLMGIDHERLTYRFQGRDFRLTDVAGRVVHEVLA